jgi:galactose-1-phosphate uridylyltransferase
VKQNFFRSMTIVRVAQMQIEYDPTCYLCPGNSRAGGARNPAYTSTFVFRQRLCRLASRYPAMEVADSGSSSPKRSEEYAVWFAFPRGMI